jgi:hypothetical protein
MKSHRGSMPSRHSQPWMEVHFKSGGAAMRKDHEDSPLGQAKDFPKELGTIGLGIAT